MKNNYDIFDGMELGSAERDASGVPVAWRLLRTGRNELVKDGRDYVLELSPETLRAMAEFQASKEEEIPIDSRHALYLAAKVAGVSEAEAARQVPEGTAALGFGRLESRPDGLWLVGAKWTPLGATLLRQGMARYFSPVVRGLEPGGVPRVTSVALDNVPALTGLEAIAASGETKEPKSGGKTMKKTEEALRGLLEDAALALSEESDAEVAERLAALRERLASLEKELADIQAELKAAEDAKAEAEDGRKTLEGKVTELELAAESARKRSLVSAAVSEGRVTNAQAGALLALGEAALSEFLKASPAGSAVPHGRAESARRGVPLALGAEELEMARRMGVTEDEMRRAKLAAAANQEEK